MYSWPNSQTQPGSSPSAYRAPLDKKRLSVMDLKG